MRDVGIRQAGAARLPPGRHLGFVLVAAMHAGLIWLVAENLAYLRLAIDRPPPVLDAKLIEAAPPQDREIPTAGGGERIVVDDLPPPPTFPVQFDDVPVVDEAPLSVTGGGIDTGDEGARAPVLIGPRVDPARPLSQPAYPPQAIRAGEEGTVTLQLFVGLDGRVLDARVAKSSGYARLDAAAVAEARRSWRLSPATLDGRAVERWHKLNVVFDLDQR